MSTLIIASSLKRNYVILSRCSCFMQIYMICYKMLKMCMSNQNKYTVRVGGRRTQHISNCIVWDQDSHSKLIVPDGSIRFSIRFSYINSNVYIEQNKLIYLTSTSIAKLQLREMKKNGGKFDERTINDDKFHLNKYPSCIYNQMS